MREQQRAQQEDSCCPRCRLECIQRTRRRRVSQETNEVKSKRDDIQTTIRPSQHQQVAFQRAKGASEDETVTGGARSASSMILRALRSGGSSTLQQFNQLEMQDSFGEAARALGRRLSLGGSSFLSRMFASTNYSSASTTIDKKQESITLDGERERESRISACDIPIVVESRHHEVAENCTTRSFNDDTDVDEKLSNKLAQSMGGLVEAVSEAKISNDDASMSLFESDEFTRRHRQSIAVQTFFTKSIELNEEDNDDDDELADRQANYYPVHPQTLLLSHNNNNNNNYYTGNNNNNNPQSNTNGRFSSTRQPEQATLQTLGSSARNSLSPEEEVEDLAPRELPFTRPHSSSQEDEDDTTTSGWTAPTSGLDSTSNTNNNDNNNSNNSANQKSSFALSSNPAQRCPTEQPKPQANPYRHDLSQVDFIGQNQASYAPWDRVERLTGQLKGNFNSPNDDQSLLANAQAQPLEELRSFKMADSELNRQQQQQQQQTFALKTSPGPEQSKQHDLAQCTDIRTALERHLLAHPIEQINSSDFSSFTLATSNGTSADSHSNRGRRLNNTRALAHYYNATQMSAGRKGNLSEEEVDGKQQMNPRRAFSDTEAHRNSGNNNDNNSNNNSNDNTDDNEDSNAAEACKMGVRKSGISFESHKINSGWDNWNRINNKPPPSAVTVTNISPARGEALTRQLVGLPPPSASLPSKPTSREIRSAEPTRHCSPSGSLVGTAANAQPGPPPRSSWAAGVTPSSGRPTSEQAITRGHDLHTTNQTVTPTRPRLQQQQQHQQWCHSATFSSSLNSDISTSGGGGGPTKDTTEKDSSRRTSTLSGISSIYQQEISLATTTTTGGPPSHGTPANSTVGAPTGMGSIPELADPDGFAVRTDSPCADLNSSSELEQAQANQQLTDDELADQPCADEPTSSSNLQRVAASFRSQLRERLSHPLTVFGLGISMNEQQHDEYVRRDLELAAPTAKQQTVNPLRCNSTRVSDLDRQSGSGADQAAAASLAGLTSTVSTTGRAQSSATLLPRGAGSAGAHTPEELARQNSPHSPTNRLIQTTGSQRTMDTPTPASLRSFFRSTSSAAFNAFASSFQQSSSSTPTGTTVITQPFSGANSQTTGGCFISGSLSGSDVFADSPAPQTAASPLFSATPSTSTRFGLFTGALGTTDPNQAALDDGKLSNLRSPLSSPLSVTSTRFFARIRDKFSLNSPPTPPPPPPPPPLSTKPATHAPNEVQIAPNVAAEQASPPCSKPEQPLTGSIESSELHDSSGDRVDSSTLNELEREPDSSSYSGQQQLENKFSGPQSGTSHGMTFDDYAFSAQFRKPVPAQHPVSATTTATLRRPSQPIDSPLYDPVDDYERLISARRPSYQRQLDEQVNQVYQFVRDRNYDLTSQAPSSTAALLLSQQPNFIQSGQQPDDLNGRAQLWLDSSQQSVDSSSSARSLRSCWFSMPELYAMNRDTQSPSLTGCPNEEPGVNGLLNSAQINLNKQQQQQQVMMPVDWPAGQLYQQVMNSGKSAGPGNWSLSDLNLTSDDIAPRDSNLPAAHSSSDKMPQDKQQEQARAGSAEARELEYQLELGAQLAKGATLDDSICASIEMRSSSPAKPAENLASDPQAERPTSQNSTISSNSCALSELNSSCDNDLSSTPANPDWPAPPTLSPPVPGTNLWPSVQESSPSPEAPPPTEESKLPAEAAAAFLLPSSGPSKQLRAMSLVPPTSSQGQLPSGGTGLCLPVSASSQSARRCSALGGLLSRNPDMAPAAASLELRLAARKNRMKLTDLHPITFINDRQFLSSLNSVKTAGENKLNAIFDSPVGRRLSMNAEMAAAAARESTNTTLNGGQVGRKFGFKIGLTGYVYMEQQRPTNSLATRSPRRPSLAPNFWRAPEFSHTERLVASAEPQELGADLLGSQRRRAASCVGHSSQNYSDFPLSQYSSPEWIKPPVPVPVQVPIVPNSMSNTERRRSAFLLKRLTESSIELDSTTTDQLQSNTLNVSTAAAPPTSTSSSDEEALKYRKRVKDSSSSSSSSCSSSSSSSDDGDIDKLVAQYAQEGNSKQVIRSHQGSGNEAVLRQLLLAAGSAASPSSGSHLSRFNSQSSNFVPGRRFSAINLYQRDEDMFVANSMRRPPVLSPGIQLGALSTLAGTLPVLPLRPDILTRPPPSSASGPESQTYKYQSPVKSIISGSSGLNMVSPLPVNNSRLITRASSVSSALVAGVDVEEQLNRLRQQERRTLASFGGSFGSAVGLAASASELIPVKGVSHRESSVGGIWPTPEEEDESASELAITNELTPQVPHSEQQVSDTHSNPVRQIASESSQKSISPSTSQQLAPSMLQGAVGTLLPSKSPPLSPLTPVNPLISGTPYATTVSGVQATKIVAPSLEPFKQLDTIIEGRGLLLGFEQQADPNYANMLRRLSGNHSRRSSLTSNRGGGGGGGGVSGSDSSEIAITEIETLWCKCDPSPARRRSTLTRLTDEQVSVQKQSNLHIEKENRQSISSVRKDEPEQQNTSSFLAGHSSTTRFVLNTVRSLARRTLDNLTMQTVKTMNSNEPCNSNLQSSTRSEKALTKQRSTSLQIESSTFPKSSTVEGCQQPVIPSRMLRDQVRQREANGRKAGSCEEDDDEDDDDKSLSSDCSGSTSVTGSADDSSDLISLDDAENYLVKNKENTMRRGRSMDSPAQSDELDEVSSSSLASSSSSTLNGQKRAIEKEYKSCTRKEADREGPEGRQLEISFKSEEKRQHNSTQEEKAEDEEEAEMELDEEEEEEEEEVEKPKICYKCNRKIKIEKSDHFYSQNQPMNSRLKRHAADIDNGNDDGDEEEEEGDEGEEENNNLTYDEEDDDYEDEEAETHHSNLDHQRPDLYSGCPLESASGTEQERPPVVNTRGHRGGRRHARRSASMNVDVLGNSSDNLNNNNPRRKNKWHIQRNLAPKLKRQRSFSANYAPEVPNPMMPPPRRFSAAPTLTCPHRNKSSSQSSSSLHHTYSIDSSESMITVIPSNRALDLKSSTEQGGFSARGSLSCSGQMTRDGSFYALSRSPLSPRSPSRCSPGFLTPNISEPPTAITEPPFSPATTTCSSTAPNTVLHQSTQQQNLAQTANDESSHHLLAQIHIQSSFSNSVDRSSCCSQLTLPYSDTSTQQQPPQQQQFQLLPSNVESPRNSFNQQDDNQSLVVENGTSCNSSRNDLNELSGYLDEENNPKLTVDELFSLNFQEILPVNDDKESIEPQPFQYINEDKFLNHKEKPLAEISPNFHFDDEDEEEDNPNKHIITETINDFCYRHSKEELEYLIGQLGYLRISDSYFSERSSTVCMVIEVKEPWCTITR